MKRLAILILLGLPACATTVATAPLTPSAVTFSYHPPKTEIEANAEFVLVECDPEPKVAMDVKVKGMGVADTSVVFQLDGDSLGSATQKHNLHFELSENRTLKSLNAESSDRTGAIIANVLKTVATVATAALGAAADLHGGILNAHAGTGAGAGSLICNEQTYAALRQAEDLRNAIDAQRDLMGQGSPDDATKIAESIDALATRLASVTATDLSLSLSAPLKIGDGNPVVGKIRWTILDLTKWFATEPGVDPCQPRNISAFYGDANNRCQLTTELLGLDYKVVGTPAPVASRAAASPCLTDTTLKRTCGKTVAIVEPVMAFVTVSSAQPAITLGAGDEVTTATIPVAQWGAVSYLPIDVKFMQSRTVGMTFDDFGRKTTFTWTSEATAENATSALSDIATNGVAVATALKGMSDLDQLNDENTRLEAEQKNVTLKSCKKAMDAGATSCP
jgi:hypothetical protein